MHGRSGTPTTRKGGEFHSPASNARPETLAIGDTLEQLRKELPFDPLEYIGFTMPKEYRASLRTDAVD